MYLISLKSLPQISITATELLFQFLISLSDIEDESAAAAAAAAAVEGVLLCGPPK